MKQLNQDNLIAIVKELSEVEAHDGFEIVGIFGSYASRTQTEFSDVDIAYRIDHELFSQKYQDGFSKLLKIDSIKEALQNRLQKKVDLVSLNATNEKLKKNILKDMIYV